MPRYLVVAHQTAESPELIERLRALAQEDAHAEFVLLVPATPASHLLTWTEGESVAIARARAASARARFEAEGLRVVDTVVGDGSPANAIQDALGAAVYDAVVVCTFPVGMSRWLKLDLISQARRAAGYVPVMHVEAAPARKTSAA
jgi:hypothetical protein